MRGRVSVHPRGFGFVTFDARGLPESSAFVAPPDLNRFLADDIVDCEVVESGGRQSARDLVLVSRPRARLFGQVVRRDGRSWLRVDRLVANTDWPLDGEAPEGAQALARVDGTRAALVRVVDDPDAVELERLLARHDLASEHPPEVVAAASGASVPPLGGRRDLRGLVTVTRTTDVAHVIVERLMVAANEAVARFLVERGLPAVFRVHDPPTLERTRALADAAQALGVIAGFSTQRPLSPRALAAFDRQVRDTKHEAAVESATRRLLGPARYTTSPSMHFGLAAPLYLHFTSPIRRYADLAVHRILRRWLRGDRTSMASAAELEPLCEALNDQSRRAARAENERERLLVARYFATRLGLRILGVVVANKPGGALVQIEGATAMLPGDPRPLGEALEVIVTHVDETLGRIDVRRP